MTIQDFLNLLTITSLFLGLSQPLSINPQITKCLSVKSSSAIAKVVKDSCY